MVDDRLRLTYTCCDPTQLPYAHVGDNREPRRFLQREVEAACRQLYRPPIRDRSSSHRQPQ